MKLAVNLAVIGGIVFSLNLIVLGLLGQPIRDLRIYLWAIVGLSLVFCVAFGFHLGTHLNKLDEKKRRREYGLCIQCGYNLTYSPEPKICPECGTPAESKTAHASS